MIVKYTDVRDIRRRPSRMPEPPPPPESGLGPVYVLPRSALDSPSAFAEWWLAGGYNKYGKISYIGGRVFVEDQVRGAGFWIPKSAFSPDGFCDWAFSGEYPSYGKVEYIGGKIYIDMNAESINTHLKVKLEITTRIKIFVDELNLGLVYPDGTLVKNKEGDVSNEPDAMFCTWETLLSGRAREATRKGEADDEKAVTLVGAVDWVLEIISPTSVRKDNVDLKRKYFRGGVGEYWVIDARGGKISFQVFTRGKRGFTSKRPRGG
jgi:Uma2 family endonuclease